MMKSITILLALVLAGINDTSAETSLRALSHQRRDLSAVDWWYSLLNALHVPCPHHDEEKGHCAHHSHHHSGGGGGVGGGGGGGGGGGSSYSYSYCSFQCNDDDANCVLCSTICSYEENCLETLCCADVPECSDNCADGVDEYGVACYSCDDGFTPTYEVWGGDAWESSYSKANSGVGSKAMFWGIGAGLCALVAAAALFMTKVSFRPIHEVER